MEVFELKLTEEIMAERLHKLGLGIYDENGTDGNIYLDNIPDIIPKENDEIICVYQSGSFRRAIKVLSGSIRPILTIYVKGRNLINTMNTAQEICKTLSEDEYSTDEFIVHQTFIFSEPTRLVIDEKDDYIFSFQIVMTIEDLT